MYDFTPYRSALAAICRKWNILGLKAFGSSVRGDFGKESDIDLIISLPENTRLDLFDLIEVQQEFQMILGRKVDVLTERSVERMENYLRRSEILSSTRELYAQG